jgi:outer membrane protein
MAAAVFAQSSSFPKPSYFRETFSKPISKVELQAPARLSDFVVDGKVELSLRSYLELVMANNTDIQIQKLAVETPRNAILRAYGAFDPIATGSFNSQRSKTPSSDALQGASTLVALSQPARFNYSQTLETGTTYTASFLGTKSSTNSGFQNFNPALNSSLGLSFAQPLIRNRGTYVNRLSIMTARSRLRKSEYDLRTTLMQSVNDAETVYWNMIQARENLKVQEAALSLSGESLKRAQRELQLGALSPLDIFDPERQYATAQVGVSQAQFNLQQSTDQLRRQIGADLDPEVRKMPVVLTEDVAPEVSVTLDPEMEVEKAYRMRPDMKSAMQSLDVDDLSIKSARNSMLPDVSLTGGYTAQGRGGPFYQRTNVFTDAGSNTVVSVIPGGFGDALSQMFNFGYPVWSFGLNLRLPIRNRAAAADLADALVARRRDTLTVRSVSQQIRLDVLNAVSQVESSKEAVRLSTVARDYAQKTLDAEKKKYELGTSQLFFVLQAENNLVNAESNLVTNLLNYRKFVLNLYRRTGELLEQRNIAVQ